MHTMRAQDSTYSHHYCSYILYHEWAVVGPRRENIYTWGSKRVNHYPIEAKCSLM